MSCQGYWGDVRSVRRWIRRRRWRRLSTRSCAVRSHDWRWHEIRILVHIRSNSGSGDLSAVIRMVVDVLRHALGLLRRLAALGAALRLFLSDTVDASSWIDVVVHDPVRAFAAVCERARHLLETRIQGEVVSYRVLRAASAVLLGSDMVGERVTFHPGGAVRK